MCMICGGGGGENLRTMNMGSADMGDACIRNRGVLSGGWNRVSHEYLKYFFLLFLSSSFCYIGWMVWEQLLILEATLPDPQAILPLPNRIVFSWKY